ncbi:NB-ARC domain-containing protein [Planoprotostelium fungivorum]|uniref:NB-ARC domain-containing protein n=1 Tax=Planoprotostelium fungivorum TaxID=1890364 RepID=A0A2P6NSZ5_9EUKA|nr:NB-ARC domain-containing protein [Planoprotostelium fungivorum]
MDHPSATPPVDVEGKDPEVSIAKQETDGLAAIDAVNDSTVTQTVEENNNIPTPPPPPSQKGEMVMVSPMVTPRKSQSIGSENKKIENDQTPHPAEIYHPSRPDLPQPLWVAIFLHLESPSIARCKRACHHWCAIINQHPEVEWKGFKKMKKHKDISLSVGLKEMILKSRYQQAKKKSSQTQIELSLMRKIEFPKELKKFEQKYGLCLKVLEGHNNAVHLLKYDNGFVYSASSEENEIRCWKAAGSSARPACRFIGHTAGITVVKIRNNILYSGSLDTSVRLWDVTSGKQIQCLTPHVKGVSCIKTLADGTLLTGAYDGKICRWNVKTGLVISKFHIHSDPVTSLQLWGEEHFYSFSEDETLRKWNLTAPDETSVIKSVITAGDESVLQNSISTFRVKRDKVIYGTLSGVVVLIEAASGKIIRSVRAHTSPIVTLKVKRESIYVTCEDGTYSIWDINSLSLLHRIEAPSNDESSTVHLLQVVGNESVYTSNGKNIYRFDLKTGRMQQSFIGHTSCVVSLKADHKGSVLISGGSLGTMRIWTESVAKATALQDVVLKGHTGTYGFVTNVMVSGDHLISISNDGTARSWSLTNGTGLQVFKGQSGDITSMAIQDGGFLFTGSSDRTIIKWNVEDGTSMLTLKGHTKGVTCLCLFQDQFLFSGSADHTVRKWNLQSGKMIQVMNGHKEKVTCFAALGSAKLISGSSDKRVIVWSAPRGESLHVMVGHNAKINDVKVADDAKLVFSCADDKTIRIWNPESGICLHVIRAHSKVVQCLQYFKSNLFAGSYDSTISLNKLDLNKLKSSKGETPQPQRMMLVKRSGGSFHKKDIQDTDNCRHFRGHNAAVMCLSLDPLDKEGRIYSGSEDGTIKGWNIKDSSSFLTFTGHSKRINKILISNETIVSASNDQSIRVWPIQDSTPTFLAVRYGQLPSLQHLVEQDPQRLFERGYLDRTLLMVATHHGQIPIIHYYMNHSEATRQCWYEANSNGETCLYFALVLSRWQLLKTVMGTLPDISIQHPKEKQLLTEMVAANNFVYLNEFLTSKISYSSISAELVGLAAANDALETVQAFVRHDPNCINHRDTKGRTPLHHAAEKSRHRIMLFLLKHNANLNILDVDGQSPLHLSVNRGHLEAVKTLIERGCVVNCFDKKGQTPIHLAVRNNNTEIVDLLTQQEDLNPNAKDSAGKTAMHYALSDRGAIKSGLIVIDGKRKPDLLIKDNKETSAYVMLLDRITKAKEELTKPKGKAEKKSDREDFLDVADLLHQANGLPSIKAYRQRYMILKFMKTFGVFILFLGLLTTHVFLNTTLGSSSTFYFNSAIKDAYVGDGDNSFSAISSPDSFYEWLKGPMLDQYYDPQALNHTMVVGFPRLTQFRVNVVPTNHCDTSERIITRDSCQDRSFLRYESTQSYGPDDSFTWKTSDGYFKYSDTTGWIVTGGGFIQDFPSNKEEAKGVVERLEDGQWIDGATRVIFLDFTIYTPNLDLFSVVRLVVEFTASGAIIVDHDLVILNLMQFFRVDFYLFLDIIVYIMIIVQTVYDVSKMLKKGNSISAYALALSLVNFRGIFSENSRKFQLFSSMIILRLFAFFSAYNIMQEVQTNSSGFINFHSLAVITNFYKDFSSLVLTLAWLQLLNALQTFPIFGEKVHAILTTLVSPAVQMLVFLFVVVILSFSFAFHAAFGSRVGAFKAPVESFLTLIAFVFGGFETEEIFHISPVVGPVLFILFMSFGGLVLLNIFIAVISEYYSETQEDTKSWELFVDTIIQQEQNSKGNWFSRKFANNQFSRKVVATIMHYIDDNPAAYQPTSDAEMKKDILLKNRAAHSQQTIVYSAKEIEELGFTPFQKEKKELEDLIEMEQESNSHTHTSLVALSRELEALMKVFRQSTEGSAAYRASLDERMSKLQKHIDRMDQKMESSAPRKTHPGWDVVRPQALKIKSFDSAKMMSLLSKK